MLAVVVKTLEYQNIKASIYIYDTFDCCIKNFPTITKGSIAASEHQYKIMKLKHEGPIIFENLHHTWRIRNMHRRIFSTNIYEKRDETQYLWDYPNKDCINGAFAN